MPSDLEKALGEVLGAKYEKATPAEKVAARF